MALPGGWLADLFGYRDIFDAVSGLLPRRSAFRIVGGSAVDNDLLEVTDIITRNAPGGPWLDASAHATATTSATTANQNVGSYPAMPGAFAGVDCVGAGQMLMTIRAPGDGADVNVQAIVFTFKVVGGSMIISSTALDYGVTTQGSVSIVANGAGFKAQVTPALGTLWRWDSAVNLQGRLSV